MVDKISGQVGVQAAGGNKMARRGENIHKRKDGRWEGRYIKARTPEGKIQWGYVYGIVYAEVKRVLIQKKAEAGFYNLKRTDLTFEALAEVWLHSLRNSIKESTYAHYSYTLHKYLLPVLSKVPAASLEESFLQGRQRALCSKREEDTCARCTNNVHRWILLYCSAGSAAILQPALQRSGRFFSGCRSPPQLSSESAHV